MRRFLIFILFIVALFGTAQVHSQALKVNAPFILMGCPNIGAEINVGRQFTVNGDVLWSPYLFKKNEEVMRALIGSVDFRYYINPKYYYTNNMFDGFYIGPYAMVGNFNVGFKTDDDYRKNIRNKGWGVSGGASLGYKFYLSPRLRMDINLGIGYAHLQYNRYYLGGEWADYPIEIKKTKSWIGPTKFGVHLVYNIFK